MLSSTTILWEIYRKRSKTFPYVCPYGVWDKIFEEDAEYDPGALDHRYTCNISKDFK